MVRGHLKAIGLLPAMATLAVPAALTLATRESSVGWGLHPPASVLPVLVGAALILTGLTLMYKTISLFATVGKGTLAPWEPTQRLVVLGPYRYMRHPMITGVMSILLGEAAILGSLPVLLWFGVFVLANAIYLPTIEEPGLVRRFGDDYLEYRRHVPRWIPRVRPWLPGRD